MATIYESEYFAGTYTYTIVINKNGGDSAPSGGSVSKSSTAASVTLSKTVSSTLPKWAGHNFLGYAVRLASNPVSVQPGDTLSSTFTGNPVYTGSRQYTDANGNLHIVSQYTYQNQSASTGLFAKWALQTFTVSYDANGGSGAPSSQTKTYDVELDLTSSMPTRSGYNFASWNTKADGTGTAYASGGKYYANASTTLYAQWEPAVTAPTFTTQPSGKTVYRGASASLSVAATATVGTVTYQWQSSSDNSSFSNISGATSATYSAPTTTVGTKYYRCVATSTSSGLSKSTNSNAVSVIVNATPVPTITQQPSGGTVGIAESKILSVTASGNSLSYKWYSSTDNSTWSAISGATSSSYTAPTSAVGTKYYKVRVTNTLNGYTAYVDSNSVSVVVVVAAPTFTTQPSSNTVYRGASVTLTCAATAPYGTVTYQWYSSPDKSNWTSISGATSTSYSAPTTTTGTVYYRVTAKATYNSSSSSNTTSNIATVKVKATPAPTITEQPADKTAFVGDTESVSVTATGNSLSYQWQRSNDNSTFSNISGATSSSYTFPTSSPGTTYYRCVVKNTLNGYTKSTTSNSASAIVNEVGSPAFTTNPVSAEYDIGATAAKLKVTATSNGSVSYQWQSSSDNVTFTNISGATSNTYTPPTNTAGIKYYRARATAVGGSQTKTSTSSSASITVYTSSLPVFVFDLSTIDVTYNAGDVAAALNGTATVARGTISYQWQKSTDGGTTWFPISKANSAKYTPETQIGGTSLYRVVATNTVGTASSTAYSNAAKITVANVILDYDEKWAQYISSIDKPFTKLARLDFLQPNGSVLLSVDNNPRNERSKAFIQDGTLTVNLENGPRRMASVTLSNLDGEFDYNVNKLWFGQQVQLWEGMILPSGHDFYISQGVFYVKDPDEVFEPGLRQTTLNLVDKWSYLDGSLFGNLDGTYEVPLNSNIFNAVQSILNLDRGNGQKVDSSVPIFTNYYNGKSTTLPDGTTAPLTNTPYTYRCDSENGTYADIILELNNMLAGWIGYDACGQLRLDPSQDDILDTTKPILWQFTMRNSTFLGATYSVKNSEVYNDIIIIGESLSEYGQTAGRATNYDPQSDTNANIIGLKTKRYQQSGYYTQDICESLAVFKLKRESVLKKSVSISCSQMFHLQENNLVTIERSDKPGNPIERHLITGYTRPIAQTGPMTLNCTSVQDFPTATVTQAP